MKENETTKNTLYQLEEKMNREHWGDIQLFEEEDNRYSIAVGKAILLIKELEQYKAIGTVEELQALKEVDDDLRLQYCYEDLSSSENRGYMQGYNKAIDEFAKCLKERWIETEDLNLSSEFFKFVDKVAEQMKGGATDERICRKTDW